MWTAVLGGCSDVVVETDIHYDERHSVAKLDVYSPPGAGDGAPAPAVVVIHGGGWREASDRDHMGTYAERFAQAGYVAFNVEYRGTPDGGGAFPGAVQDVVCALAFVRANAARWNIDPARIASYGYSAGGHLAQMLGVAASSPVVAPDCAWVPAEPIAPVAAVVNGAGPTDMFLFPEVDAITDFLHGGKDETPEIWRAASPITYVTAAAPPFLHVTGGSDWFVPVEHAEKMQDALHAAGVPSKMFVIPGGGHLLNRSPSGVSWDVALSIDTPEAWAVTIDFLDRTIGGGS